MILSRLYSEHMLRTSYLVHVLKASAIPIMHFLVKMTFQYFLQYFSIEYSLLIHSI